MSALLKKHEEVPSLWGETFDLASRARPLVKWAGGKTRFLHQHSSKIPPFTGRYLEPFFGGGSVFFHLCRSQTRPFEARLGDTNLHLIRTMLEVKRDPGSVFERLNILQAAYAAATDHSEYYYELRDSFNRNLPRTDAAAFIF